MGYREFTGELQKLLFIKEPRQELRPETSLKGMDSLAITELCVLAEEELGIALGYQETRDLEKFSDLQDLLSEKGLGP